MAVYVDPEIMLAQLMGLSDLIESNHIQLSANLDNLLNLVKAEMGSINVRNSIQEENNLILLNNQSIIQA